MIRQPLWRNIRCLFENRLYRRLLGNLPVAALKPFGLSILIWPFLAVFLCGGQAQAQPAQAQSAQSLSLGANYRAPLAKTRNSKTLNQIFVFDNLPLSGRLPVILIPGRAQEFQDESWWKKMQQATQRPEAAWFRNRCKLYVFLYDSNDDLDEQTTGFVRSFKNLFTSNRSLKQPTVLVSYSLGGLIAREAMEDPSIFQAVQAVWGISVPFHGSPLLDPQWYTRFLRPPNHSPIRKTWDSLLYRTYLLDKSNLTRGMRWDNFDGSRPQFEKISEKTIDKAVGKFSGKPLGEASSENSMPAFTERPTTAAFKQKLILYASYLENESTRLDLSLKNPSLSEKLAQSVVKSVRLPKSVTSDVVGSVLPLYGLSVHDVFRYNNYQLSNLKTYTPKYPQGENQNLYRYNDGIIPLSSMLYLPARPTPYYEALPGLINLAKTASCCLQLRLFKNLDHTNMGEYSPRRKKLWVADELSFEEGIRTPIQWILFDLKTRFVDNNQS